MTRIKWLIVLMSILVIWPAAGVLAAEQLRCFLVKTSDKGVHSWHQDQYVDFTLDHEGVPLRPFIHIKAASKDMTFANCAKTEADSSIVSGWFETKCTKLESFNGSPYTIEAFLADTVAGISPPVQAGYEMYEVLSAIGTQLGTGTPDRTFVIYSQGPPLYEFFCYRQDPPDQSKCSGKC